MCGHALRLRACEQLELSDDGVTKPYRLFTYQLEDEYAPIQYSNHTPDPRFGQGIALISESVLVASEIRLCPCSPQ